jgi:hypothetical protein
MVKKEIFEETYLKGARDWVWKTRGSYEPRVLHAQILYQRVNRCERASRKIVL